MTDPVDPYGHQGAIADAQWTARWMQWNSQERDAHFAGVVHWGVLDIDQCEQLLQGLPPRPHGWLPATSYLAASRSSIARLRTDVARGAIPPNPTAAELASWCDQMHVSLPAPLVDALENPAAAPGATAAQSPVRMALPAWASPAAFFGATSAPKKPARGRPKGSSASYGAVIREGSELLLKAARDGRELTLPQVAKQLTSMPVAVGMNEGNILRRLKGRLPVAQAKETAAQARIRSRASASLQPRTT